MIRAVPPERALGVCSLRPSAGCPPGSRIQAAAQRYCTMVPLLCAMAPWFLYRAAELDHFMPCLLETTKERTG